MVLCSLQMQSHKCYLYSDTRITTTDFVTRELYPFCSEHVIFREEAIKLAQERRGYCNKSIKNVRGDQRLFSTTPFQDEVLLFITWITVHLFPNWSSLWKTQWKMSSKIKMEIIKAKIDLHSALWGNVPVARLDEKRGYFHTASTETPSTSDWFFLILGREPRWLILNCKTFLG